MTARPGAAPLSVDERALLRAAARHARAALPAPVGETVAERLTAWEAFGYRFGSHQLLARLLDAVLAVPAPSAPAAARRPPSDGTAA